MVDNMDNCFVTMINPMGFKKDVNFSLFIFLVFFIHFLFGNVTPLDISINNRLFVAPSDCYMRISIGSRLADSLLISTIQIATVSDCEAACSANGTSCGAFSFGVGARGNGTCMLGRFIPQRQDNLQQDPDYDVYVKGHVSLIGCRSSQNTLSIPLTGFNQSHGESGVNSSNGMSFFINNDNSRRLFGNSSLLNAFGRSKNRSNENSSTSSVFLPKKLDDDVSQIFDILPNDYDDKYHPENKNVNDFNGFVNTSLFQEDFVLNYENDAKIFWSPHRERVNDDKSIDELFGQRINPLKVLDEFPLVTTIFDKPPDYTSIDTNADDNLTPLDLYSNFGQKINSHTDFELGSKNDDHLWWLDSSFQSKQQSTDNFAHIDTHGLDEMDSSHRDRACFRRVFSGKRISDAYVRRAMECDTLHDCHRMCEYERGFTCDGFNYRSSSIGKSTCELTSVPSSRVDINRDFTLDRRCQYYERDWSQRKCYEKKDKPPRPLSAYPPQSSNNWWAANPRPISWNASDRNRGNYSPTRDPISRDPPLPPLPSSHPSSTHSAPPYGGSFSGNTQLTLELPRPIDPNRKYPISRPSYSSDDSYLPSGFNINHRPLPVRPLDTHYHQQHERPAIRPGTTDDPYYRDRVPQHGYKRPNYSISTSGGGFDGYNGNGYSYGRPLVPSGWQNLRPNGAKYPNKRIGYGPNTETNEVGPLYISADRRPPPKIGGDWDNYGHLYANGYHTNYIGGGPKFPPSQSPNIYPSRQPAPPPPPPPPSSHPDNEKHHHYGQFYNYGGGYGYANRPELPPKIYPPPRVNQCSPVRSTSGFKLTRQLVRTSYLTSNLEQCEKLCAGQKNFICHTFAYRYSLASTSPFDNCLLSDAPFENLVFYTDLEPDRDYDIYAMVENSKWCQDHAKTPGTRYPRPPDECFWRVRSGFCMPPSVIKKPIRVDGMGECQVQCVGSRDFTCRSFVFRYETYPVNGIPNCFLSDWPAMEVEPKDMQDMDGAEFYERGSYGRGCESHPPNILPSPPSELTSPLDETHNRLPPASPPDDASCYADYDRPCKLTPYAIIYAARVSSQTDCRRKCSAVRQRNMAPCMAFNFRTVNDDLSDNCYLTDISMRDLRPGLDYTHDQDHILYVWRELEPKCSFINDHYNNKQPNYQPTNVPFDPGHTLIDGKPYVKPENPYYYEVTVPEPNKPGAIIFDAGSHSNGNGDYDNRFLYTNTPDEFSLFRRFTVNGQACKRGTRCERNTVAGFWSCEPEGAELGDWDYCCEPNHHCGFSHGFNYPWCYVGSSGDQWRPCNDKYYPYQLNPRPNGPALNRPPYSKVEIGATYHSRHWPITFLHSESPPNGTDSVALANDVTDESITNKSIEPVIKIDSNISSESVSNHTMKRGVDELITAINKKRKEYVTVVPLKSIGSIRSNRTGEKFGGQRLNSRFKKPRTGGNVTVNYSPRFSRDRNNGQFYVTKKLNARLPTRSINGSGPLSKGNSAKIEKITKIHDSYNGSSANEDFVTTVTSMERQLTTINNTIKLNVAPVSVELFNETTSFNAAENNWKKMKTFDRSNV